MMRVRAVTAKKGNAMTVTLRQRNTGKHVHWQADIHVTLPSGETIRERRRAHGSTRVAAMRWAKAREIHLLRHGKGEDTATNKIGVPTLGLFVGRFRQDYLIAERLRPTTLRCWERLLQDHLLPVAGEIPLDEIGPEQISALKQRGLAASTTNLVLRKLQAMLRRAHEWKIITEVPKISKIKEVERAPEYYDFDAYSHLVNAARSLGPLALAVTLLGGDAGMRIGEILGLRRQSVLLNKGKRGRILVRDNDQDGVLGPPKGGKDRWVPLTRQLREVLEALGDNDRVLSRDGAPLGRRAAVYLFQKAQKHAGLSKKGPHILRHTFCSHLAIRGVSAVKIQRLAGHAKLSTTQVYMHLAPSTLEDAIDALDR